MLPVIINNNEILFVSEKLNLEENNDNSSSTANEIMPDGLLTFF